MMTMIMMTMLNGMKYVKIHPFFHFEADMYNDLLDESQTNDNSIMEQSGCLEILETVLDKIGDANAE